MISIQSNYNSLVAQHHLTINTNNLSKATAKLSTGQKITCSADDAAGYFVANSLHYQLTSLEAIHETTAIAMNFTSTAEGALQDTYNNLLRCKDLATQAANSTMGDDAREAVKSEMDSLISQSELNVYNSSFNDTKTLSYVGISKEVLEGDTKNYEVAKIDSVTKKLTNDGSKTIIIDKDSFEGFVKKVNSDSEWSKGKSFILSEDIDLSETYISVDTFKGTFDGNGHTLSNWVKTGWQCTGIFSTVDGAKIKNLNLANFNFSLTNHHTRGCLANSAKNEAVIDNCNVINGNVSGQYSQGGLIGSAENVYITNCTVNCNVTGWLNTGGLVGYCKNSFISNCHTTGNINSSSYGVGGLIGLYESSLSEDTNLIVENCSSSCTVQSEYWNVGGLIGKATGVIKNCYATGNVTNSTGNVTVSTGKVGGLIGLANGAVINCHATGNVTSSAEMVGGLIGSTGDLNVSRSYATGNVTTETHFAGGLIGFCNGSGSIINCYATTGYVFGNNRVGGLIGAINNTSFLVKNCYATKDVSGKQSNIGGLVGGNSGEILNCFATGNATGLKSAWDSGTGGLVGGNGGEILNCFASGDTIGGDETWGLVVGYNVSGSKVSDSYYSENATRIDSDGNKLAPLAVGKNKAGIVSNVNSTTLTAKDLFANSWDSSAWDWSGENPTLKINSTKTTLTDNINFHIDTGTDDESDISYNKNVSLDFNKDHYSVATVEDAQKTIAKLEEQLNIITSKLAEIGTTQNRMNSIYESQMTTIQNTSAAKSTIIDTDVAQTTSDMVKSNILQKISSSVLTSANQMNANIAKKLLGIS